MKFTNMVLAASAASMAVAYPRGRDVIPNKRSIEKKRATGFTCKTFFPANWQFAIATEKNLMLMASRGRCQRVWCRVRVCHSWYPGN